MRENDVTGAAVSSPLREGTAVLLHMCCGPCAIMPVTRLREDGFAVTGLFYNPNIHPLAEYLRRREAAATAGTHLALPVIFADAAAPDTAWNLAKWLADVHNPTLVDDPCGPARCAYCYRTRLMHTAHTAKALGFAAFSSSLFYSRMQRHELIIRAGQDAAEAAGVDFIARDFRPDWQAGIDQSRNWALFRQNYCGCIYSEAERFTGKYHKIASLDGRVKNR